MRKITNGWNKFWHRLLVLFLFTTFSLVSWGQAILTETFNYATPAYIGGNGNAGSSSNGWTTHSVTSGQTTTIDINSGSLSYSGLLASTGNKVYLFGNANATSRDVNAAFTTTNTTMYYSALINIVDNSQITTTGDYFMTFAATSGTTVTVFGSRLGAKSVNTGANFRLMIQNMSGGTPTWTDNGADLAFGTTYLVVVKYDRSASPTVATMWVNPSTLGSTEPAGSVSNNSGTTTFAAFASICLRNNATTPKAYIDEIRVGTTFADVTPKDVTPPTLSSNSPADNAIGVLKNTTLSMTFSENIAKGTGNIVVYKSADDAVLATVDVATSNVLISGATATVTLPANLPFNTECYVQVPATAFTDIATNAYAGIADKTTWSFTTAAASTTATLTSAVYTVTDGPTWTISAIPANVAIATFEGNLTPAPGATFETYEGDATTVATDVQNGYKVKVIAEDGIANNTYTLVVTPSLTADATANNVDNNQVITFADDATWRAAITAVKDGSNTLTVTTDYTVAAGVITLIPSATNTLKVSGSRTITVLATGYADAAITQNILAGAINTTNSTVGIDAALALLGTSTITFTAKDQYNNLIDGYTAKFDVTITDGGGTDESYTVNGTAYTSSATDIDITPTNTSGVSTFSVVMPGAVDGGDGISIQVQLNNGTTNLGSSFTYSAPLTPSLSISASPSLTEATLSGADVTVTLQNATFTDATLDKANFTLNNAPSGVTINTVTYSSTTGANIDLAYDGTDFDANVTTFNLSIAATELNPSGILTSNNLAITANIETAPVVTTDATVASNGFNTATWGGSITSDGGELVTEKGICWSLSANPTIADNKVVDAAVGTTITGNLTGLTPFTQYYVKAYATNLLGTSYGDERTFTTLKSSAKAITATTIGTLDEGNKKILNVPGPKTVAELKAAITVSPLATFEVYTTAGGTTVATGTNLVSPLYVVRVTAQDLSTQEYTITIEVITVDNLLALRSLPANTRALYTGKATVTYTRTSRNQKYIQDATGAVLIDDPTTAPGFITGTYAIGDGITNIEGKIVLFSGLVEFTPTSTTGASVTGNPVITPEVRTMASLTNDDQCKLVKIVNLTFTGATGNFASSTNYVIDDGTVRDTVYQFRTAFSEANYISTPVPNTAKTVVSLVGVYKKNSYSKTNFQITARNSADFQSAVATVSSTIYTIGVSSITNVPFTTSLATFKANLTAVAGANFNVFDADGTTPATVLDDTKKVIATAEDGLTKTTYTITRNAAEIGKDITAYSIGTAVGVITGTNIAVEVSATADLTSLIATFTLSAGAKAEVGTTLQANGITANNFTSPVVYKVTAEDGTFKNWTVTVTKSTVLKDGKDILTYSVAGVNATIDAGLHTVKATLPYGTSLTNLVATFTLSDAASAKVGTISQASGVTPNNFSSPVTYTVTAENASTLNWVVTITNALPSADASVSSTVYTVGATSITNVPYGTPLATFKSNITPATNAIFEVYQSNGTTIATDLATGYKLISTAQDGITTKVYTITVNEAPAGDLFFSEYVEGSSNNKVLEIFNPTDLAIDLSAYVIKASNNGLGFGITTTGADTRYVLPLSGTIAPKEVYVLANGQASAEILAIADKTYIYNATANGGNGDNVLSFNGNDALGLYKNGVLIDVFGIELSSTNFNVAGIVGAALDHTIIRKSSVKAGNTNWTISAGTDASTSEWIVDAKDVFTNLGSHMMDVAIDTEAPLATMTPSNASINVFESVTPTIVFNEVVYKATDGTAFAINEDVTSFIEFYETETPANTVNFTATINGVSIAIIPAGNLKNLVQYTLALKSSVVEDKAGNENVKTQTSFTTIASNDATLKDLKVDGSTIPGFSASVYEYTYEVPYGTTEVPEVMATTMDPNATFEMVSATTLSDSWLVNVTAQDKTTKLKYTVNFTIGAEPSYTVTFTVTDESSAIVDFAKVEFNGTSQVTDDRGNAVFTNVYAVTDAPFIVTKGVDLYEIYNGTVTITNADVTVDVVLKTVGINDQSNLVSSMYPNPTNGQVFLTLNTDVQTAQITVTDISGRVILTKEWSPLEASIDLAGNKQGIYFIEVTSGNNTFVGRIMLN